MILSLRFSVLPTSKSSWSWSRFDLIVLSGVLKSWTMLAKAILWPLSLALRLSACITSVLSTNVFRVASRPIHLIGRVSTHSLRGSYSPCITVSSFFRTSQLILLASSSIFYINSLKLYIWISSLSSICAGYISPIPCSYESEITFINDSSNWFYWPKVLENAMLVIIRSLPWVLITTPAGRFWTTSHRVFLISSFSMSWQC